MRGVVVSQTGHLHRRHGRDRVPGDLIRPGPSLGATRFPHLEGHHRIGAGVGELLGRELAAEVGPLHRLLVGRRRLALDAAPGGGEVALEGVAIEPEAGRQGGIVELGFKLLPHEDTGLEAGAVGDAADVGQAGDRREPDELEVGHRHLVAAGEQLHQARPDSARHEVARGLEVERHRLALAGDLGQLMGQVGELLGVVDPLHGDAQARQELLPNGPGDRDHGGRRLLRPRLGGLLRARHDLASVPLACSRRHTASRCSSASRQAWA